MHYIQLTAFVPGQPG